MKGERGEESLRKIGKQVFEQGECGGEKGGDEGTEGKEEQKEGTAAEKKVSEGDDEEGGEQTCPRKTSKDVGNERSCSELSSEGDDEELPNSLKPQFEQAHAARVGLALSKFGAAGSENFKRCRWGQKGRDEEDACDGKARELKAKVEKPLGKAEEEKENGELQGVKSASVA